ncbi:hypothetical protein ES703_16081 [subsurface metagenome]
MESPFVKEDSGKNARSQLSSPYLIKKALMNQHKGRCADCYRRTVPVRLVRVWRKRESPKGEPYILLCDDCIVKRRKKEKEKRKKQKKRLWRRKTSKGKISKGGFFNRIRKEILERDNFRCLWCGDKEHLGLGSLIPISRGGKLTFNNYVTTCQHCRPSKGNKLPLEFIAEPIFIEEYLNEQLDEGLRLKSDPGKNTSIRFGLLAEISEFLHKLTNNNSIPGKLRTKSERLNIKLLH